ncbi:MAG: alpha/beta hydrolase family protein [Saprospiraceae bacterium]
MNKVITIKCALFLILYFFSGRLLLAQDLDRTQERVSIPIGKYQIDGLLLLPKTSGKKAAIIFIGGSGEWEIVDSYLQNPAKSYADQLLYYGAKLENVAFLFLNKRGMGKSTGKWRKIGIEERADDALAAFKFLQQHPQIDPDKIGIIGHSQGGWIAQLAASRNPKVAFSVAFAGPAMSVYDQTILNDRKIWQHCEGLTEAQMEKKLRKRKLELGLGKAIGGIIGGEAGHWKRLSRYNHDMALKQLKTPTLFVFGEYDLIVPAQENLDYLQQLFSHNIPHHINYYTQTKMDHFMREREELCGPLPWTMETPPPFSEGLRDFLTGWIQHKVGH